MKTCVIALGGNALLKKGEKVTISVQYRNIENTIKKISFLVQKYNLVITHGNGPQVGNALIRVEEALGKAYALPLDVVVAETEAEIGYIIEQVLGNELKAHHSKKAVVGILTQVLVNKNDGAFQNPSKFIGPFYSKKEAENLRLKGLHVKLDPRGGYRRVVASPTPLKIVESDIIKKLGKDTIIIAAGGGGIPVYEEKGKIHGIEAVIDKDLASAVLARDVSADLFLIITDVPYVYINFKKKNQKPLKSMNVKRAMQFLKQGHFGEGSMKPKVEAAINFLSSGGKKVIITSPQNVEKALKGRSGTIIVK